MRYKSAICILSLLCACGLPAAAWAAPAEYAVIELRCLDESVVYTDYPVRPTNHIVADEIAERRINGTLPEKAEQMDNCLSSGSTYRYAVTYTFPRLAAAVTELKERIDDDVQPEQPSYVLHHAGKGRPMP